MSRTLYIISTKIKLIKLKVKDCIITTHKGLITLSCKDRNPTIAVLTLIEHGVPASAISAWICGPVGRLAEVYQANPNHCEGSISYATIACSRVIHCAKIFEALKKYLKSAIIKKNREQQQCCILDIKFNINLSIIHLVEIIEATGGKCIMLKPIKLPPLPKLKGNEAWISGCFRSKALTFSKTHR